MNSVGFENQILDAIETIVDNAVKKAGYDKTIKAVVMERLDANTGKYKAKYQDGIIEAYYNNTDVIFPSGTLVNILVPNGDFSQNKVIIDAVEKGKIEYAVVTEEDEEYQSNGGNTIAATQMFGLCSYKEKDIKVLYNREAGINDINFDALSFAENIKDSDNIICGAEFRTDLDEIQKSKGNFGIVFDLDFKDNKTGDIITKSYKVDINQMKGNPYNLNISTRQYGVFKINKENFDSVNQIYIFSEKFPNTSEIITRNDIYAGAFELSAVSKLSEEELNNYILTLNKSGKGYFDSGDTDNTEINIAADVKLKNKSINSDINYYWFKENNLITIDSVEYSRYGGEGWECLNNYNLISESSGARLFITSNNNINIKKSDVSTGELKIKCVIVKGGNILLEKEISITNYDAVYTLTIESSDGVQFYYDNGSPTLTCKINGLNDTSGDFTYQWSYTDNNGVFNILEETTEYNEEYNNAAAGYALLVSQIETGKAMPAASQEQLNEYLTTLEKYSKIQRVEGNIIYNTNISQILDNGIYKCTVWKGDILIGTASVILYNTLTIEGDYHIEIKNGTQSYIYNGMGVSPASDSLEKPITIQPLSFVIKDNLGYELGESILQHCEIEWTVPKENTLIIAEDSNDMTLSYTIAEKYDTSKLNNNTIQLSVKYKDLILNAQTDFTFVKEGEPGTNGTEIICKIVPNTDDKIDEYPMIFNGSLNYTPKTTGKWFKIQLWQSGNLLWEGSDTDSQAGTTVTWSILKNQFNGLRADVSNISVSSAGIFSYNNDYQSTGADIVKGVVTYRGKTYYCTIPMIVGYSNSTYGNYRIKLVKDTGFRYVMYSSDGTNPQYDNTKPFTIQVERQINNYWEDVSTIENDYKVSYVWSPVGRIYAAGWTNINPLIAGTQANNTKFFIPKDKYDGECVNVALEVQILDKSEHTIGYLHIPIHYYLDRYGIAALNEWDGNKITLNNELGAILAPQVGAGKKDDDNQFTGVLMGSVKESARPNAEEGLFGYHKGVRTIFLDANTGKAEFGKAGKSRIILDPTVDKAQLYSGNYSTTNKTGMLIDLTTPEIRFGSGKFVVNSNGQVTATDVDLTGKMTANSGKIGNWTIDNGAIKGDKTTLTSDGKISASDVDLTGKITATSGRVGNWYISSGAIKYNNQDNFYLNSNGSVKFGKFSIDTNGNATVSDLKATNADISGKITATSGTIGGCAISDGVLKVGSTNITSLNADVINAGSMSLSRLSGGTMDVGSGGGYLRVGVGYTHPEVSGLNITGNHGIEMNGTSISGIDYLNGSPDLYLISTKGHVRIGNNIGGAANTYPFSVGGSWNALRGTWRIMGGYTTYVYTGNNYYSLASIAATLNQHGWLDPDGP